jgi:anti-sigma B factor antagonist
LIFAFQQFEYFRDLIRPKAAARQRKSEPKIANPLKEIAAMAELNISERQAGDVTVLDMDGKITIGEGSVALRSAVRRLLEEGKKKILLNLARVGYIDSSGIGELVSSYTAINKDGGQLKLLNLTQKLQDLLTITKLLTVFDVYDTEPEALNSFK